MNTTQYFMICSFHSVFDKHRSVLGCDPMSLTTDLESWHSSSALDSILKNA